MSIKRRLARLETSAPHSGGTVEIVREHIEALLPLYVATEVIWWPYRVLSSTSGKSAVAVLEQRRKYREVGLRWSGGSGGSAANWKRSERQRSAMVKTGVVNMTTRRGVPFAKLTDSAIATIRGLIGLPQLDDGARVLRVAVEVLYDEANPYCRPGGWIGEARLSGVSYDERPATSDWHGFESMLLPLLMCGAIDSRSTAVGHIYYRVGESEPDYMNETEYKIDEAIQDRYLALWSLDERTNWMPNDMAEVVHSLAATR